MGKAVKVLSRVMLFVSMIICFCGCGAGSGVPIDYADAESFEAALNAGENLENKVVQFVALELHPDSAAGYDVWAGEHLNFVSERNPDIKAGDTVVVRAVTIKSALGSWFINYEKVTNGVITDATISKDASTGKGTSDNSTGTENDMNASERSETQTSDEKQGTSSFTMTQKPQKEESEPAAEKLPLEIVDYGWYINEPSSYSDNVHVDFCGMIHNPNETWIANFPEVVVTVKNGDGSILATEEQMGGMIMPGDTITLCGMFSMPVADLSDDAQIIFDTEWRDFSTSNSFYENVRTTDFVFTNVSEHNGSRENIITGEITNNSSIDVDNAYVSIVLRKDGKIVFMENTFVDGLKVGKTKAFEFQRYHDWPEHDTIDCSAMAW